MTSKIKIKLGPVEVEYEGSEEFLKKELPELLSAISKLYKESGIVDTSPVDENHLPSGGGKIVGTTGTISGKLKVNSGPDLAVAAAARLTLGDGRTSFSRNELLNEMKSAASYYRKSYSSNLTKILNSLVKNGKFIEVAANTYSLSASTKSELEASLAS